jgi:hypothetical protein
MENDDDWMRDRRAHSLDACVPPAVVVTLPEGIDRAHVVRERGAG